MGKSKKRKKRTPKPTPPFETQELIGSLQAFLDRPYTDRDGNIKRIGSYKWGVYIFYDYDGEPIYVGQTKERVRSRIGRHLTNQRTDAVAMSVLDPFEVCEIAVYPLAQFEGVTKEHSDFLTAKDYLDALENFVHGEAIKQSPFHAILNEKDPPKAKVTVQPPVPLRGRVVSDEVFKLRSHPDVRIARRAQIVSRLAQTISERQIKGGGLRRALVTQAKRIQKLAADRFQELGGEAIVERGPEDEKSGDEDE